MAEYRKQKELPQIFYGRSIAPRGCSRSNCQSEAIFHDKDANYLHNSEKSSTFVPAMNKMLGSKPRKS
jgi:hypothetical protein